MKRPKLTVGSEVAAILTLLFMLLLELPTRLPDGWLPVSLPSTETLRSVATLAMLLVIGLGLLRLRQLEVALQAADRERRDQIAALEMRLTDQINYTGSAINGRVSEVEGDLAAEQERLDRRVAGLEAAAEEQYAQTVSKAGAEQTLAALEAIRGDTPAYKFAKRVADSEGPKG